MLPRLLTSLAVTLALALAPAEAAAWCLLDADATSYARYWRSKFPDLRIPVYVSTGHNSALTWTGLAAPQIESIVRRTIAVHNETVSVPTLYFAGTTDIDLDPDGRMRARPRGIVIDSFTCAVVGVAPPCGPGHAACTEPGGNADDLVAKARVTFEPGICGPNKLAWSIDITQGTDATRVLLHELGHALGLDHTSEAQCAGATDGVGGAGVMNKNLNYWPAYERAWRRDDLEGLRAIYGAELRHRVYTWRDDAFPGAPEEAAREPLCFAVRTPPTLTSAVDGQAEHPALLLATTDVDDRVAVLEWDGSRFVAPADGAVIDRSRHGVSFAPVGLAHGDGDGEPVVLVVWSADDSRTARESRLRWARRPLAGGAWELGYVMTPGGPTQTSNRVAVGHDPTTGQFLLVSTTDRAELYITAIDGAGAQRATTVFAYGSAAQVLAFDVGPPRCFVVDGAARCTIAYTEGDSRQFWPYPVLTPKWIEVAIADDGAATLLATHESALLDAHGLLDLAAGPGLQRGVVGEQRFALAPGEPTPVVDSARLAGDEWPLRIGSHAPTDGEASFRVAARRLAPCGDGVLECEEQCDDGNHVDGDGCSAACLLAPGSDTGSDATGDAPTGADSSGESTGGVGPGAVDDDGCGCATDPRTPGLLGLLGLLGLRRRARGRASDRAQGRA